MDKRERLRSWWGRWRRTKRPYEGNKKSGILKERMRPPQMLKILR